MSAVIVGGAVAAGGAIAGSVISSNAASNAANTQSAAAQQAQALQYQEFLTQENNQAPYLQAGTSALAGMQNPSFQQPFTMADFQQDPSYQFDLQQGQQAIQRSAAASGGLQSGGTMKAMAQYTQGMASNDYEQAYNNYNNNQTLQFNRLASVANLGQTANAQTNAAGMNMANQAGNDLMGGANAQAAAGIASGNQWGKTLSGIGTGIGTSWMQAQQTSQYNNMLSNMSPGTYNANLTMPSIGGIGSSGPSLAAPSSGGSYWSSNPYSS